MEGHILAEGGAPSELPGTRPGGEVYDNERVRVQNAPTCRLCGRPGQSLYSGLRDRLFTAPGVWNISKCQDCGLVWLNPQPVPEDIGKLYEDYYTHGQAPGAASVALPLPTWHFKVRLAVLATHYGYRRELPSPSWELMGKAGGLIPMVRQAAGSFVMYLPMSSSSRLVDIGCGNGTFLASMRERGWRVQGIEPDPAAARVAREQHGLEVFNGSLESAALPAASIDAITMHHVIEHVPDPVALLRECCRVLRPGGRLVAITPNIESLGHRLFGVEWFPLDPPRHLHLFSIRTLGASAKKAGLGIEFLSTISRESRDSYIFSDAIRRGILQNYGAYRPLRRVDYLAWAFLALEEGVRMLDGTAGEELVLIAARPGEGAKE